jgi:hypothetical protein
MAGTKVSYSLGVTYNLGNYEALRVDICMEETIGPSHNRDEVFEALRNEVETRLHEGLRSHIPIYREMRKEI